MINFRYFIAILLCVIALIIGTNTENKPYCPILRHPRNITINNILGTWYGVRGIEHTGMETAFRHGTIKDCRSITISQSNPSEIIFQWNGPNSIKLTPNPSNFNLLQSTSDTTSDGQTGKTLQITELDEDHIVITLCSPSKRLSSAVLHREPVFNREQVTNATNKLTEQNLIIKEVFDRCQSAT